MSHTQRTEYLYICSKALRRRHELTLNNRCHIFCALLLIYCSIFRVLALVLCVLLSVVDAPDSAAEFIIIFVIHIVVVVCVFVGLRLR
jgi:hypothetical protein